MADITIGDLPQASAFDDSSLLVTENQGRAQKVPGKMIKTYATDSINAALQNAKDSGEFDGDTGPEGSPGRDGVSPTVTTATITGGHRVSITDATGTKSFDVKDGKDGADGAAGPAGAPGYTPQRGTDYWTPADQSAIVQEVLNELPEGGVEVEVGDTEPTNPNTKIWVNLSEEDGGSVPGGSVVSYITNPDCHAEYFQVTENGVASLKPEYRGKSSDTSYPDAISDMGAGVAGSKNSELPSFLVVPEIVDGVLVDGLAGKAFEMNMAIERVALPKTITTLPAGCFSQCYYLKEVYNTEKITSIGSGCFQATAIRRASFPELADMGEKNAFYICGHLVYADIGKVEDIPDMSFDRCGKLNSIVNSGTIHTVGQRAFRDTPSLRRANFVSNLTNIGQYAFAKTKFDYDWASLANCTFGTNATSLQMNPTDFWSACTYTACANPLPTKFSQYDPRWADRVFTTWQGTGRTLTYADGCTWLSILHIYCGLKNLTLSAPMEFESIVDNIDPVLRNTFVSNQDDATTFMQNLGLNATLYSQWNKSSLQAVYNALANGGYVCTEVSNGAKVAGHAAVIYGVDNNGDFLILDSTSNTYDDRSAYVMCSLPYKSGLFPDTKFIVVTP